MSNFDKQYMMKLTQEKKKKVMDMLAKEKLVGKLTRQCIRMVRYG